MFYRERPCLPKLRPSLFALWLAEEFLGWCDILIVIWQSDQRSQTGNMEKLQVQDFVVTAVWGENRLKEKNFCLLRAERNSAREKRYGICTELDAHQFLYNLGRFWYKNFIIISRLFSIFKIKKCPTQNFKFESKIKSLYFCNIAGWVYCWGSSLCF